MVKALLDRNGKRLITLLGLAGVGKSAVARDALHYVLERRYFGGGVIHIDLDQVRAYSVLENKVKNVIFKSLGLTAEDHLYKKLKKVHDEQFIELLEDFFEQKKEDYRLKNKTIQHG